ncbi:uncharacterized protein EI90DRAFT_1466416 [Cantharellus anzutake]|uniref:uncharacterized protein n=1 Tax=Cantharellus anzutake TaxID=1750568 RepID=UPI001904A36B|nr:uncharacterized protein EI90DRAFT_1466416 [Cantharellus anzutake]KAF8309691.1 hypothetical protein EI90DRAFT_1466416 [Cantharellus anzutake]
MSPVDSPEPPLKSPPGTVLPECTPATEENGPVRSRPSLDEEPPVDFVGDCPVPGDEKDEESDIDPATNIWNLQLSKMPPSLEENIPPEFLPDILMVEDCGNAIRYHSSHGAPISDEYSSVLDKPVKFRRVLPSPADNPKQGSPSLTQALRVAKLDLSLNYKLGRGNHSDVYLVSLRLPHPLSARTPTGEVSVACKMAHDRSYKARQLLENEAGIYASFPDAMSEGGNGYVLFTPKFKSPVPSGPVVPKFYGYYKPVYDPEYYAEEEKDLDQVLKECMKAFIEGLSPILLMEHCGSQISPWRMSNDNRNKYMSLLHRMHLADYTHKSAHVRNVVVQPGPLTLPPRSRSLKDPSFRLVDFGRTMHLSHYNKQRGAPAGRKGDCNWDCGQDDEFRELQGEVW